MENRDLRCHIRADLNRTHESIYARDSDPNAASDRKLSERPHRKYLCKPREEQKGRIKRKPKQALKYQDKLTPKIQEKY